MAGIKRGENNNMNYHSFPTINTTSVSVVLYANNQNKRMIALDFCTCSKFFYLFYNLNII